MGIDEDREDEDWQKIMASGFNAGGIDSAVPLLGDDIIKHADNAIDYGEEDELADDEDLPEEEPPSGNNNIDDNDNELSALMTEGNDNIYNNQASFGSTNTLSLNQPFATNNYEESLEERVGSDYAAALMGFDDDWMGGGNNSYSLDNLKSGFNLPSGANGLEGLSGTGLDMDINMPDALRSLPSGVDGHQSDQQQKIQQPEVKLAKYKEANLVEQKHVDPESDKKLLKLYYPDFEPDGVLKINTIFTPRSAKLLSIRPKATRPLVPTKVVLEVEPDQRVKFKSKNVRERLDSRGSKIIHVNPATSAALSDLSFMPLNEDEINEQKVKNDKLEEDLLIATADWDTDHLWDEESDVEVPTTIVAVDTDSSDSDDSEDERPMKKAKISPTEKKAIIPASKKVRIYSPEIYDSDEEDGFFEGTFNTSKNKVILDMNDSHLLFTQNINNATSNLSTQKGIAQIPITEKSFQLRYNISNDRAYDLLKENYQSKVRSIVGNLNIDHSMVALRLQSPHYKVKLSKAQMRSYHRPTFVVKPNTVIHFSKVKLRKRKRDKGKRIQDLLNKTNDLTLGDSAQFFLLEYSEEFPLILSNFGMGSKIINYYRKSSPDDNSRPKLPTGETNVLSLQDRSAFWNFGFVEPGKIVPTLYNKMIRAPVFKHEPASTDFLLIRSTGGGLGQRYFLRSIPHLFTVGQTFPATPIPGPHSRKVTTASKNRLKMVVFRVLNKSEHHRISVKDISAHFPGQNEMQNRQRLKEFMEFQRTGPDQGFWKMRGKEPLPNEDQIRAMISPEDIALLEAMQVGQQHLEDAGYSKTVDYEDDEGDSIEEQLAPWNITRNFINATQGKAMLQLHGEGDPSGCGEGFSFLRTSMKGGFKAMGESVNETLDKSKFGGHSYNVALQQKAYDDEISRIWYTQAKALSNTKIEDLGWDETDAKRSGQYSNSYDPKTSISSHGAGDDDNDSDISHSTNHNQNKILKITRLVRDKNGTLQRKIETITEPNIIRAYVKRRREIEDSLIGYVTTFRCFHCFLLTTFLFLF